MDLKDKNQMSDQELDKVSGGDFIINIVSYVNTYYCDSCDWEGNTIPADGKCPKCHTGKVISNFDKPKNGLG